MDRAFEGGFDPGVLSRQIRTENNMVDALYRIRQEGLPNYIRELTIRNLDDTCDVRIGETIISRFSKLIDNRKPAFEEDSFEEFSGFCNPFERGSQDYRVLERFRQYVSHLGKIPQK